MADVTGAPVPKGSSPFDVPGDLGKLAGHFGDASMFSVANVASLPTAGNWAGRMLMAVDTGAVYLWNGSWKRVIEDTGWVDFEMKNSDGSSNGFNAYSSVYQKPRFTRRSGIVTLQGSMARSAGLGDAAPATWIGQLPVGFRPSKYLVFPVSSNGAVRDAEIGPDGRLVVGGAGSWSYARTDVSITFPAEQ